MLNRNSDLIDQFISPGRAIGLVCVGVYAVRTICLESWFTLVLTFNRSSTKVKVKVACKVHGHRREMLLRLCDRFPKFDINGDRTRGKRCFTKHKPHACRRKGRKCRFCP